MEPQAAIDAYDEWVWDSVRNVDFPSTAMLDRLERNLRGPEDASAFVELVIEKAGDEFKSPEMMARVERITRALVRYQMLQEQAEEG